MKNNLKITIINAILIIFFLISNTYSIEQFNFDITEIEITDNGNKFKGLKRGSATSDSGLKIEADTFEYDKITNILNAYGDVKINDPINDYILFTNDITYIKNKETIFTKGITKAIIESKYNFLSKNVTFYRNKKELHSSEFSEVKDEKLTQYNLSEFNYSIEQGILKGRNIEVISDYSKNSKDRDLYTYKDGIFNLKTKKYNASDTKIYLKNNTFGKNNSLVSVNLESEENLSTNENAPRIYGASSSKKDEITVINKGIFTSCGFNDGCPPWSIKAEKITHNENKKQITYDNAFLNIYNLPVLYFPKFFHPDPTVKRQSGLLMPQINDSDILGTSILIPYFHVISENKDLTVTPTIFDTHIKMLQTEYRQKNKSSNFIVDAAHVQGYKSNLSQNKNGISHLFAKYDLDLNLPNFENSILNLKVEKVTNDTYLKIFDTNLIDKEIKPNNDGGLSSNLNFQFNNQSSDFTTGVSVNETLNGTNSDRYQYILPYYNYNTVLGYNEFGQFNFSSSGYNNLHNTNSLQTSLNNDLNFLSRDFFTKMGFQNNFGIYFKNLNTIGKNYSNYKSSPQSEIMSLYNFETNYPLIKKEENYINYIKPKLSIRLNPGEMKNYSNSSRSINSDNIFSIDRLSIGGDSFEEGRSLTAGINYTKENINDINKYFSIDLASVYRDKDLNKAPNNSGIRTKSSNLFGSVDFSLLDDYLLEYDFSLDNNFNNIEYNNVGVTFKKNNFLTKFNFIEENGKIGQTNSLANVTEYKFNENNYVYFGTRRNRETSLTEYYDLIYEYKNDCLSANIKYKKTYYQDRDLTPDEQIFFSITLFPLTTLEQKINPDLYR